MSVLPVIDQTSFYLIKKIYFMRKGNLRCNLQMGMESMLTTEESVLKEDVARIVNILAQGRK